MVGCPIGGDVRIKTSTMGGAVEIRELGEELGCDQWWNEYLPAWLEAVDPTMVVVVGGYALAWEVDPRGDDDWCRLGDGTGRCEEWAVTRLSSLTARIREHAPSTRIVFTTAGHVDPWGPLDIPTESIDVLNELIRDEAARAESPVVDLGTWLDAHLDLTVDGTHLGPEGVEALAPWMDEELTPLLRS
jgi:lysophospholipase L1-like esterase